MSVASITRKPVRAIEVKCRLDLWFASFRGDQWTARFRTEPGPLPLVMEAIAGANRHGLPIVVFDEVAF